MRIDPKAFVQAVRDEIAAQPDFVYKGARFEVSTDGVVDEPGGS